jgi:hypothetical protein
MSSTRRDFLKQSGIAAAGMAVVPPTWSHLTSGYENKGGISMILRKLAQINDERIPGLLEKQVDKPGDRWDGGAVDEYDLPNAHSTNWFIVSLGSAYASEYSAYYLSPELEGRLESAANCLLNVQHDDGAINLHSTNFHSTPDTAFLVNYLSPVYVIVKNLSRPGLAGFIDNMGTFFSNAGECLTTGGIHTANHRWVVCAALARVNSFFPTRKYVERIEEWLSEGIDLDPDGQFTERSVGAYSAICDNMFLTLGRLLDRDELFDVVRKNLDMTLYYIQPGGELLTDASGRQDSAQTSYVSQYYYAYRYFAIKDQNPVYAAVCNLIEDNMPERITRYMSLLMEDSLFKGTLPAPIKIPDNYFKRFVHSGVFRIRRGKTDISVVEKNPTFLSFMKGSAVMQSMRLATSFFGRGQFVSESATYDGEQITLGKSITRGYYQPFPEHKRSGDGDWHKMPRDEREPSELQTLHYRVAIAESSGKVSIEIMIEGTPYVPVSLEMSFRAGGELAGVVPDKFGDDMYFLESGVGEYRYENDVIRFGHGTAPHRWAQMRGMLPKQDGISVYLTGHTPFRHVVELS